MKGGVVSSILVKQCEAKKTRYGADTAGEDGSCCDSFKQEIKKGNNKMDEEQCGQ